MKVELVVPILNVSDVTASQAWFGKPGWDRGAWGSVCVRPPPEGHGSGSATRPDGRFYGARLILNRLTTGVLSTLPARSRALTRKTCLPRLSRL